MPFALKIILLFILIFVLFILITTVVYWAEQRVEVNTKLKPTYNFREIDFVVTWVDADDQAWYEKKLWYSNVNSDSRNDIRRFGNGIVTNIEIETCVRSILKYAPWSHKIWIVTDDQVPRFIEELSTRDKSKVKVIFHKDFFVDTSVLPTFNSHTIEANLYNIPGLAERFIYMNDDMFFTNFVSPKHFFDGDVPLYRSTYLLNVRKTKLLGKLVQKINPSAMVYLRASSNLSDYGNRMFIWRYKHHAVPLLKSFFNGETTKCFKSGAFLKTDCLCKGRFRNEEDVPPIHCAVIHAIKNKRANIYRGPTYRIYYGENLHCRVDLSEYHECCINNNGTIKQARATQNRALRCKKWL